jgi:L-seryl-tRNA(Ser) seleniumtransferase
MHYLKDEAEREIPLWQMVSRSLEDIRENAMNWQKQIGWGEVVASESTVGGGSLPGENLPTWVLSLTVRSPDKVLSGMRKFQPPVVARAQDNRILLDPRTVFPEQNEVLLACLKSIDPAQRGRVAE